MPYFDRNNKVIPKGRLLLEEFSRLPNGTPIHIVWFYDSYVSMESGTKDDPRDDGLKSFEKYKENYFGIKRYSEGLEDYNTYNRQHEDMNLIPNIYNGHFVFTNKDAALEYMARCKAT